ncbi:MAG: hypothetical protein M3410_08855 [Acidobacteriota bacterium]|nr:hypothetical protein [Acidobacteriota bacterium]
MKGRIAIITLTLGAALALAACSREKTPQVTSRATPDQPTTPRSLPDNGFKAEITLDIPPAKFRAGQKESIPVRVKNVSDVMWYARGGEVNTNPDNRFYLAVGNRWLKAEGEQLVTNMDGRYGLPKNLKPGEEVEVPLQITAPQDVGEYILEIDLVQEQVAWFSDKGSTTAKVKVAVVR